MVDLVIRNGTVVDGTGAPPVVADVAIDGGRIVAVGRELGPGAREIDATGCSSPPAGSTSTPTTTARPPGTTCSPRARGTASPRS